MFNYLSTMEMFYLACAIAGGALFLLRSLMMVVGMGGDDGHDFDSGGDGSPTGDFKMVSLHSITAFILMFGLTGFLMTRNAAAAAAELAAATAAAAKEAGEEAAQTALALPWFMKPWFTGAVAFLVGLVTMLVIAKLFQSFRKLQSDGTIHPSQAVGAEGSVYLAIRPGEIGKVQLTVRGAFKIYDARANDPALTLKTGDPVKVVSTGDVLVVERLN